MKMNTYPVIVIEYTGKILSVAKGERDQSASELLNFMTIKLDNRKGGELKTCHAQAILDLIVRSSAGIISEGKTSDPSGIVDNDSLLFISAVLDKLSVKLWSSRLLPDVIHEHIKSLIVEVENVCKYFHGDFDVTLSKMYAVTTGKCSDVANMAGPCAHCIGKYSSLVGILEKGKKTLAVFHIARQFQKHHHHEAKGDEKESLVRARKWEQYLLHLMFEARKVDVATSAMLDLKYIPEVIPSVYWALKAEVLIREYQTNRRDSAISKTHVIKMYRKMIVSAWE